MAALLVYLEAVVEAKKDPDPAVAAGGMCLYELQGPVTKNSSGTGSPTFCLSCLICFGSSGLLRPWDAF